MCSWVGKYVLGCTNTFSGLEENKCAQMCVCSFPSILMDTIKYISILCQPILAADLRPCSWNHKWGLSATIGVPAAVEMCDMAKLSQPCSKNQT